jgi:hypothetical protein
MPYIAQWLHENVTKQFRACCFCTQILFHLLVVSAQVFKDTVGKGKKVKFFLCLTNQALHQEEIWGMDMQIHVLFTSAPVGSE